MHTTANIDQVFLKVSLDMAMLFSQPLLVHRRETAHPVLPMKSALAKSIFLKVSPDMAMLFYQLFVRRKGEMANPVPAKVFLQVSPDSVCLCA